MVYQVAAVRAMRRARHDGQNSRRLQKRTEIGQETLASLAADLR